MKDGSDLAGLMARYQAGDGNALAALYEATAQGMINFVYGLTGDRALSEDVLQEVFLRVHRVRHTYTPGRPVRPWLYGIARHVAIDALRKRRREVPVGGETILRERAAPAPGAALEMADIEAALAGLPKTQREAFLMTKVSGLSVREAAAALGTTEGAVKVGVHRAVKALRSFLDQGSEDSGD
jgi:RNA polymerase sigma-70 factor (ECF subfamily)